MSDHAMRARRFAAALMVISTVVFLGLFLEQNMWVLICVYWGVLTVKNWDDWRQK